MRFQRRVPAMPRRRIWPYCSRRRKRALPGTRARATRRGASAIRDDAEPDAVDVASVTEKLLMLAAFLGPAGFQKRVLRSLVCRVTPGRQLVKPQPLEPVSSGQPDGLASETLSPCRLLADHERQRRRPVLTID